MASRIKFNNAAFTHFLAQDPTLAAEISKRVRRCAAACGEGYQGGVDLGTKRMRGYVVTTTVPAMRSNSKNNTLVSNIDLLR